MRLSSAIRFFLLLVCSANLGWAQPVLKFKHIDVQWPDVKLFFSVMCDDFPSFSYHRENFLVKENGVPMQNFTITCPDTAVRCPISVSLVFDASGSMSERMGIKQDNAIQAGHIFLEDFVDGTDEASIIWFNSTVNLALGMTTNKQLLNTTIDQLPATGGTKMWDGLYAGLIQTSLNGHNPCRAVVLLTDGADNMSKNTLDNVMNYAVNSGLKVFTIGLGIVRDSLALKKLADTSGGRYFTTEDPVELRKIYRTIAKTISLGEVECILTYTGSCLDGGDRTVHMTLQNFCGGSDTSSLTFHAPDNTGRALPLHVDLRDTTIAGGNPVAFGATMDETLADDLFHPFEALVRFDRALLTLRAIATGTGDLLAGVRTSIRPVTEGAVIRIMDSLRITGRGRLFSLVFDAVNPDDTVCTDIVVEHWSFDAGCMSATVTPARICLLPCHLDPVIAMPDKGVLCVGDSITLDVGAGFRSHEWRRNGVPMSETGRSIVVRDTGVYTVRVTTAEWCSAESRPAHVTLYAWSSPTLGRAETRHLTLDKPLVLPMPVFPALEPGAPLRYAIDVRFDETLMRFDGIEALHGGAWTDTITTTESAGSITVQSDGITRDSLTSLFGMRFTSRRPQRGTTTLLSFVPGEFASRCVGTVRVLSPAVMVEGICDRIMLRDTTHATLAAWPNPTTGPVTTRITLPGAACIILRLCDAAGRTLRTLMDGGCTAGETLLAVELRDLQPGVYFLHLTTDMDMRIVPLSVVR